MRSTVGHAHPWNEALVDAELPRIGLLVSRPRAGDAHERLPRVVVDEALDEREDRSLDRHGQQQFAAIDVSMLGPRGLLVVDQPQIRANAFFAISPARRPAPTLNGLNFIVLSALRFVLSG
jgi:hypothetical protein